MKKVYHGLMLKARKPVPFEFVLDALSDRDYHLRAMFGATALYLDEKIVLILREKETHPDDNGVWLATSGEHHESLRAELPSMRDIRMFGPGPTGWQNIPSESEDFESEASSACELIRDGDPRIGKIPVRKRAKTKSKPRLKAKPKPKPKLRSRPKPKTTAKKSPKKKRREGK